MPTAAHPRALRGRLATTTAVVVLAVAAVCSVIVSVAIGAADISPGDVWAAIVARFGGAPSPLSPARDAIVWELRLPRALAAAAVGAGLALCGAVLQTVTRNPLAEPYLLGLSSGAGFGAVCVIILAASLPLQVAAFAGAAVALTLTLLLAGGARGSAARMILAGVAVSAMFGALTSLVVFWSATGDSYREVLGWLLGSLSGVTWPSALVVSIAVVVIGVPLVFSGRVLDAFTFGDDAATALGVHVPRARLAFLAATALLTGILVSVSGSIGFVGLVVPHLVRMVVNPGNRSVLPVSALLGAVLLVWADTLARTAFAPRELPVGVLTALVGVPVFALVLIRSRRTS